MGLNEQMASPANRLKRFAVERDLTITQIERLINAFNDATNAKGGLSFEDFSKAFTMCYESENEGNYIPGVPKSELMKLYMEMDVSGNNLLNWDDFTTTLILRSEAQQEAELSAAQVLVTDSITPPLKTEHQKDIFVFRYIQSAKRYLSASRDGQISVYSESLRLQRTLWNLSNFQKQALLKHSVYESKQPQHTPWTLDVLPLEDCAKVVCSCDNGMLHVYDLQTLERRCSLVLRSSSVTSLAYSRDSSSDSSQNSSSLLMGTDSGEVALLRFNAQELFAAAASFVTEEKLPSYELQHLSPNFGQFGIKSVHRQPVEQVSVISALNMKPLIVSASQDPKASLSILCMENFYSEQPKTCGVNKGVSCFAVIPRTSILVSGGLDHALRIWNVNQLEAPLSCLEGHAAPITRISSGKALGTVVSYSQDETICVWDAINRVCMQKVSAAALGSDFSSVVFLKDSVFLCKKHIVRIPWKEELSNSQKSKQQSGAQITHSSALVAFLYNDLFGQFITGSAKGEIFVWDMETGEKVFSFKVISGAILNMTLDSNRRRLLVTSTNGKAYLYNFNNGQLLHTLEATGSYDLTCSLQLDLGDARRWLLAGWSREISVFTESDRDSLWKPSSTIPSRRALASRDTRWHRDDIVGLAFAPPNVIISCSFEGLLCLTNAANGDLLAVLSQVSPSSQVSSFATNLMLQLSLKAVRACGAQILTVGVDSAFYLWNTNECCLTNRIDIPNFTGGDSEAIITALYSMEEDSLVISGSEHGVIQIWDIRAGERQASGEVKLARSIKAHSGLINSVSVVSIANGTVILSAGSDGCAAIHDAVSGRLYGVLTAHASPKRFRGFTTPDTMPEVDSAGTSIFKGTSEAPVSNIDDKRCVAVSTFDCDSKLDNDFGLARPAYTNLPSRANLKTADYLSRTFYNTEFSTRTWAKERYFNNELSSTRTIKADEINDRLRGDGTNERGLPTKLRETVRGSSNNFGMQSVYKDISISPLAAECVVKKPDALAAKVDLQKLGNHAAKNK